MNSVSQKVYKELPIDIHTQTKKRIETPVWVILDKALFSDWIIFDSKHVIQRSLRESL